MSRNSGRPGFCACEKHRTKLLVFMIAPCLFMFLMLASPTSFNKTIKQIAVITESSIGPEAKFYLQQSNKTSKSTVETTAPSINEKNSSNSSHKLVIAMSLYGSNDRYVYNVLKNLQLAKKNFPEWTLRIYTELQTPGRTAKYAAVPEDVLAKLQAGGAEIERVDVSVVKIPPMMWRFLVADDKSVDAFIVRDCDSHLTRRDAIVVADWLANSSAAFHCVRDHPSHANFALSGGMWGARNKPFADILQGASMESLMKGYGAAYLQDMNFLGKVIWPKVEKLAYCHDSVSCKKYAGGHPFPVKRGPDFEHIGQVFDGNGVGRAGDINILKRAPVNKDCVPA